MNNYQQAIEKAKKLMSKSTLPGNDYEHCERIEKHAIAI
jgi:hypothetical protein